MKKFIVAVCFACAFAVAASDDNGNGRETRLWLPLGISLIAPPVQLPSPSHSVIGAMLNLGYGQVEDLAILDVGIINNVTSSMTGLELSAVNLAGTCIGAQVGALNFADRTVGLQIGVVNCTGDLHGIQLGLLNMSSSGGAWVFPILNFGF